MAEWFSKESDTLLDVFTTRSTGLPTDLTNASVQPYKVICEGNKTKFICTTTDCLKIFRFKSEIERHIFTHSESRPFVCTYEGCERAFKRANALQNHVRSQHTGEASLKCPFPNCEMHFTTTAKLRYHKALHLEEKPYKCSFPGCERAFVTFSQLKQHEKSPSVHLKKDPMAQSQTMSRQASASTTSEGSCGSCDHEDQALLLMEVPTKKIKTNNHSDRSKENFSLNNLNNIPQKTYSTTSPIFSHDHDEISKYFANDVEDNKRGEKRALQNVLSENDILRKELETTESLLDKITVNFSQSGLEMLEDFQNRISSKYNESFVYKNSVYQDSYDTSSHTKDVDAYFFENENSAFGAFFDPSHYFNGIYTCSGNNNHLSSEQEDLFANFPCENLSSLLFKQ